MVVRRALALGGVDGQAEAELTARFGNVRTVLEVPQTFGPDVLAEAAAMAASPSLPSADLTDLDFVTVDPPGSTDLDQAFYLRRDGAGYRVDYAIADVPAFVPVDGAIAAETLRRGQTLYAPDVRVPLHPEILSENAASLLPGQVRPAFVWRFTLDKRGEVTATDLVRALVRSRERLDYETVQELATSGHDTLAAEQSRLLSLIGPARIALERERGGASLPIPEQEVSHDGEAYRLQFRPGLESEDWNAQLSLMTGMAAAKIMIDAQVGILRTMPRPDQNALARFRRQARALGVHWPQRQPYGQFLRGLDRFDPQQLALLHVSGFLFRGAGYTVFDGAPPQATTHAAVASPYAHVTAPLRRLVDRFGLTICHAIVAGEPIDERVRAALPALPEAMSRTDKLARSLERRCVDLAEAAVLAPRLQEEFEAVSLDQERGRSIVQVNEPAVVAPCEPGMAPGDEWKVRLVHVDVEKGSVTFEPVAQLAAEPAAEPAAGPAADADAPRAS